MEVFENASEKNGLKLQHSIFDKYFDANISFNDKNKSSHSHEQRLIAMRPTFSLLLKKAMSLISTH